MPSFTGSLRKLKNKASKLKSSMKTSDSSSQKLSASISGDVLSEKSHDTPDPSYPSFQCQPSSGYGRLNIPDHATPHPPLDMVMNLALRETQAEYRDQQSVQDESPGSLYQAEAFSSGEERQHTQNSFADTRQHQHETEGFGSSKGYITRNRQQTATEWPKHERSLDKGSGNSDIEDRESVTDRISVLHKKKAKEPNVDVHDSLYRIQNGKEKSLSGYKGASQTLGVNLSQGSFVQEHSDTIPQHMKARLEDPVEQGVPPKDVDEQKSPDPKPTTNVTSDDTSGDIIGGDIISLEHAEYPHNKSESPAHSASSSIANSLRDWGDISPVSPGELASAKEISLRQVHGHQVRCLNHQPGRPSTDNSIVTSSHRNGDYPSYRRNLTAMTTSHQRGDSASSFVTNPFEGEPPNDSLVPSDSFSRPEDTTYGTEGIDSITVFYKRPVNLLSLDPAASAPATTQRNELSLEDSSVERAPNYPGLPALEPGSIARPSVPDTIEGPVSKLKPDHKDIVLMRRAKELKFVPMIRDLVQPPDYTQITLPRDVVDLSEDPSHMWCRGCRRIEVWDDRSCTNHDNPESLSRHRLIMYTHWLEGLMYLTQRDVDTLWRYNEEGPKYGSPLGLVTDHHVEYVSCNMVNPTRVIVSYRLQIVGKHVLLYRCLTQTIFRTNGFDRENDCNRAAVIFCEHLKGGRNYFTRFLERERAISSQLPRHFDDITVSSGVHRCKFCPSEGLVTVSDIYPTSVRLKQHSWTDLGTGKPGSREFAFVVGEEGLKKGEGWYGGVQEEFDTGIAIREEGTGVDIPLANDASVTGWSHVKIFTRAEDGRDEGYLEKRARIIEEMESAIPGM